MSEHYFFVDIYVKFYNTVSSLFFTEYSTIKKLLLIIIIIIINKRYAC